MPSSIEGPMMGSPPMSLGRVDIKSDTHCHFFLGGGASAPPAPPVSAPVFDQESSWFDFLPMDTQTTWCSPRRRVYVWLQDDTLGGILQKDAFKRGQELMSTKIIGGYRCQTTSCFAWWFAKYLSQSQISFVWVFFWFHPLRAGISCPATEQAIDYIFRETSEPEMLFEKACSSPTRSLNPSLN